MFEIFTKSLFIGGKKIEQFCWLEMRKIFVKTIYLKKIAKILFRKKTSEKSVEIHETSFPLKNLFSLCMVSLADKNDKSFKGHHFSRKNEPFFNAPFISQLKSKIFFKNNFLRNSKFSLLLNMKLLLLFAIFLLSTHSLTLPPFYHTSQVKKSSFEESHSYLQ